VSLADVSVLSDDGELLVVDKPSGLASHRGWAPERDVLVARVRERFPDAIHLVSRLDRGTSGVVLVARTPELAHRLQQGFEGGADAPVKVTKTYVAVTRGPCPERVSIDHPLPRREDGPRVPAHTEARRVALTRVDESELREKRYSLVLARPLTGRLHQVRRHLSHLMHPVLGDSKHGRPEHNRFLRTHVGLARLALHCASVELSGGITATFRSPLPDDLVLPLQKMGFDEDMLRTIHHHLTEGW
jgi:tRNA pseudouridine65 synthase